MSLSVGIVGLPNVGKSTLFNALLKRQVALAANYPFATIEPNTGVVPVPDSRLAKLAKVVSEQVSGGSGKKPPMVPATVKFVDIAGLVKGASDGEGLGNQFLAHIREVDLICHVIRDFADSQVVREGSIDPKSDKEIIETELMLADLATLEKQKEPKGKVSKEEQKRWEVIKEFRECLERGEMVEKILRQSGSSHFARSAPSKSAGRQDDKGDLKSVSPLSIAASKRSMIARELGLLTAKPVIYVVNVGEGELKIKNQELKIIAENLEVSLDQVLIISARIESELSSLADEDQTLYLQDLGFDKSGLERLVQKAYQNLGLQSFLTAGEKEVRAWTIKRGTRAPQAAGVIHTDFEKKFIKAKVVSFKDFLEFNGWLGAREKGKVRLEGKEYVMREGDIVEFMIGQ